MSRVPASARWLLIVLVVATLSLIRPAGAVDVSDLSDFESNPCVIALGERNKAQHVDAPDSALSDNCERAHGNPEVAWDFLLRTWQPRDVGTAYAPSRLDPTGLALGLVETLLIYALLGAPLRIVTEMLRPAIGLPPGLRRAVRQSALSLLLRLAVGALLLALLMLPLARLAASLPLLAALASAARRRPLPAIEGAPAQPTPSALAETIASIVNDIVTGAPGLLALALVARGSWRLLAFAVLLAVPASIPAVQDGRRALRGNIVATTALSVLLAIGIILLGLSDPLVASAMGGAAPGLTVIVSVAFACLLAWRAGLRDQLRRRRPI